MPTKSASAGDLADLEEADCVEIGMKKLEVGRVLRFQKSAR